MGNPLKIEVRAKVQESPKGRFFVTIPKAVSTEWGVYKGMIVAVAYKLDGRTVTLRKVPKKDLYKSQSEPAPEKEFVSVPAPEPEPEPEPKRVEKTLEKSLF